jgi:hypothetical protein
MFTPFKTLGKGKWFWTCLDEERRALVIRRQFGDAVTAKTVNVAHLSAIDRYLSGHQGWVRLSNNVSKLKDGTEKEGLGKFLFDQLGWDTTESQLASQLAALFVYCGWCEPAHPTRRRNILFRKTALGTGGAQLYDTLKAFLQEGKAGVEAWPLEKIDRKGWEIKEKPISCFDNGKGGADGFRP